MRYLPFALLLPLSACVAVPQPQMIAGATHNWRSVATANDRARLSGWRRTFVQALEAARRTGHGQELDREGALLNPDAALPNPAIPNGTYRCRVIKLGAKSEGMLDYVSYPHFMCRVEQSGPLQNLVKLSGSQRPAGRLFPGDPIRHVFLGTLVLGDEPRAMQYGQDEQRDVAGYLERIGPARWRLLMPRPHFESQLDVMELVPAS
jgi:hypothetical protein